VTILAINGNPRQPTVSGWMNATKPGTIIQAKLCIPFLLPVTRATKIVQSVVGRIAINMIDGLARLGEHYHFPDDAMFFKTNGINPNTSVTACFDISGPSARIVGVPDCPTFVRPEMPSRSRLPAQNAGAAVVAETLAQKCC